MAVALVTGASEGIGYEFCKDLAGRGYELILVARRAEVLQRAAAELEAMHKIKCHTMPMDLAAPEAADRLFQAVQAAGLQVDLLVNNAGILYNGDFLDTDRRAQEKLLQLNIVALTSLTHLFASRMREQGGGHILNVASTAAWLSLPGENVYAASKAYVLSFSQALADELRAAGTGVYVTALCPGYTDTRMLDNPEQGLKLSIPRFMILQPAAVARAGIAACLKGKPTCMPGLSNQIMMYVVQLLPRMWVARAMGSVYRRSFRQPAG